MARYNGDKKKMSSGAIAAIVIIAIIVIGVGVFAINHMINKEPVDEPIDNGVQTEQENPQKGEYPDASEEEVPDKPPVDSIEDGSDVGDQNEQGTDGESTDPGIVDNITDEGEGQSAE